MSDKLAQKSYKDYERLSRYATFPYYFNVQDNKYIYGTTANLQEDTPFSAHTVVDGDTLDSLALEYYNNPTYYWVIADFNRIRDPYEKLKSGVILKIPSITSIEFEEY